MCLHILRGHGAYVSAVAVTSDGHFAVSGSWDGSVRLWNLNIGECIRSFERHDGQIETIALTTDGHWAISGGRDALLRVWEFDWELSPKKTRNPANS
jgi:WD40 repeat protein